ncbi:hypothetical protein Csa_021730 [Cucumis sativus]|nr:hypothetical protein Csa_021730 [Cucumis sativus]
MEHVQLIRQIKTTKCYYKILGVKKNSSAQEIKRAYKKLCLKVHPDKNKASGSAEALDKVNKAFRCSIPKATFIAIKRCFRFSRLLHQLYFMLNIRMKIHYTATNF